jgi:hypothetical protein
MLKAPPDAEALRRMLLLRRNDVERSLVEASQRLRHIETRIAQIESEGRWSAEDVIERAEPAHRLLSLRRRVASFGAARELIVALRERARPLLPRAHGCALIALAHAPQFEADELDVEFGYAVEDLALGTLPKHAELTERELPAVARMAVCVRVGLPEDAHLITTKIGHFVAANGDQLDGPSREVFLQPPDLDRMHEAAVEMQFPVCATRSD